MKAVFKRNMYESMCYVLVTAIGIPSNSKTPITVSLGAVSTMLT